MIKSFFFACHRHVFFLKKMLSEEIERLTMAMMCVLSLVYASLKKDKFSTQLIEE